MRQTLTAMFDVFGKTQTSSPHVALVKRTRYSIQACRRKVVKPITMRVPNSFDFRVAATVCEKNIGTKYIVDLNKKLGLSPGKVTEEFRKKKDQRATRTSQQARNQEKTSFQAEAAVQYKE